jgi:hypothetical protein
MIPRKDQSREVVTANLGTKPRKMVERIVQLRKLFHQRHKMFHQTKIHRMRVEKMKVQ